MNLSSLLFYYRFVEDELAPAQAGFEKAGEASREMWERMGKNNLSIKILSYDLSYLPGDNGLLGVMVPEENGGE